MQRVVLILAAMVLCASAASVFDQTLDTHWANYKQVHSKAYGKQELVR